MYKGSVSSLIYRIPEDLLVQRALLFLHMIFKCTVAIESMTLKVYEQ